MSAALDQLAHLARLHEDSLRAAAERAEPDESDALIARAGERASQVEQLRDLDRPAGATAAALAPEPHAPHLPDEAEAALAEACRALLTDAALDPPARILVAAILATCRAGDASG